MTCSCRGCGSRQSTAPPIVISCGTYPSGGKASQLRFSMPWLARGYLLRTRRGQPRRAPAYRSRRATAASNAATPVTSRKCACPKRFSRTFHPKSLRLASPKASSVRVSVRSRHQPRDEDFLRINALRHRHPCARSRELLLLFALSHLADEVSRPRRPRAHSGKNSYRTSSPAARICNSQKRPPAAPKISPLARSATPVTASRTRQPPPRPRRPRLRQAHPSPALRCNALLPK